MSNPLTKLADDIIAEVAAKPVETRTCEFVQGLVIEFMREWEEDREYDPSQDDYWAYDHLRDKLKELGRPHRGRFKFIEGCTGSFESFEEYFFATETEVVEVNSGDKFNGVPWYVAEDEMIDAIERVRGKIAERQLALGEVLTGLISLQREILVEQPYNRSPDDPDDNDENFVVELEERKQVFVDFVSNLPMEMIPASLLARPDFKSKYDWFNEVHGKDGYHLLFANEVIVIAMYELPDAERHDPAADDVFEFWIMTLRSFLADNS